MPVIRLSEGGARFKVVVLSHGRTTMKTTNRFEFLDNTLFLFLLFVPINVLLASALALATVSAH